MGVLGSVTINDLRIIEADVDPSVTGIPAAIGSILMRDVGGIWQKTGLADTDWQRLSPRRKSGRVPSGSFSGTPQTAAVSFAIPYPDTNYEVVLGSQTDVRVLNYESKTTNGFTINTNAARALLGEVSWSAFYDDETA